MTLEVWLVGLSLFLAIPSIISTVLLVGEANKRPRIGALVERAIIGVAIAVMVVSGSLLTINRINGYSLFPIEVARILFLGSLIMLEFVPVLWLFLLFTRRLGDGGGG